LNKQGDLNEFLDISAGSGTHAPRQRQAFASRRLQQVISDFRKQQRRGSVTPVSRSPSRATSRDSGSGNESHHSNDPEPPAAKKRKTKAVRGRQVGMIAPRGRGRGSRISRAKSRIDVNELDVAMADGDADFVPPQDTAMGELAGERKLRPRVKPRPAYRAAKEKKDSALLSDDERPS
jgi:DNA excision repair protein ERCC-5